jgi:hypothetical protein
MVQVFGFRAEWFGAWVPTSHDEDGLDGAHSEVVVRLRRHLFVSGLVFRGLGFFCGLDWCIISSISSFGVWDSSFGVWVLSLGLHTVEYAGLGEPRSYGLT